MKTNKSNLTERLDEIAPHLQQHVMDYIDFLVERYSTKTLAKNVKPTPKQEVSIEKPEEAKEEIKMTEKKSGTKAEVASIEKTETADRIIEVTAKEEDTKVEKETTSVEDVQLDEKIAEIEEKKKNRILPDWRELKDAFLDKF